MQRKSGRKRAPARARISRRARAHSERHLAASKRHTRSRWPRRDCWVILARLPPAHARIENTRATGAGGWQRRRSTHQQVSNHMKITNVKGIGTRATRGHITHIISSMKGECAYDTCKCEMTKTTKPRPAMHSEFVPFPEDVVADRQCNELAALKHILKLHFLSHI